MSKSQRAVLLVTSVLLIVMLLFPPFKSQYLSGVTVNEGYSFILKPPTYEVTYGYYKSQVNHSLLGIQFLIIATAGGILCLALKSK